MSGTMLSRREALGMIGTLGATVAACGSAPTSPTAGAAPANSAAPASTATASTPTAGASSACVVSPSETTGPFPSLNQLFRSDIREGRSGVPLLLGLSVVNVNAACSPVAGANVEIWQCDAEGHYSEYSAGGYDGRAQTFLRGIQTTDAAGRVTFTTVYPGWYQGRATHIHIELKVGGRSVKVTQIAFPESLNAQVYASGVYASRRKNPTSNLGDMVFADSLSSELAVLTGDPAAGYQGTYTVGISV